jgi:hypothetical protein
MVDVRSLVEIEDPGLTEQGDSLIERIFSDGFYVVADDGRYLTTPNNVELLDQALALVEETGDPGDPDIAEDLQEIVSQADSLSQEAYDAAWMRDVERQNDDDGDDPNWDEDALKEDEDEDWKERK